MPERGYQLRSSGVLTFTRTSVRGCEGEASEVVLSGKWFVSHHLHVVTPTLPFKTLACDSREETMLSGRRWPCPMKLIGVHPTVIKILILFLERSQRFMGLPQISPLPALRYYILHTASIPRNFSVIAEIRQFLLISSPTPDIRHDSVLRTTFNV
jgi:hypothetical protein